MPPPRPNLVHPHQPAGPKPGQAWAALLDIKLHNDQGREKLVVGVPTRIVARWVWSALWPFVSDMAYAGAWIWAWPEPDIYGFTLAEELEKAWMQRAMEKLGREPRPPAPARELIQVNQVPAGFKTAEEMARALHFRARDGKSAAEWLIDHIENVEDSYSFTRRVPVWRSDKVTRKLWVERTDYYFGAEAWAKNLKKRARKGAA